MATWTWPTWYLSGSGWQTSYQGSGTVTCSRAAGSDYAVIDASAIVKSIGGDTSTWSIRVDAGDYGGYGADSTGTHSAGTNYTLTKSLEVPVGASSGTLSVTVTFYIWPYRTYTGGTQTYTVSLAYGSKGASTITSASNVTIGNAVNVKWTPFDSSFKYKLQFSLGDWSHTTGYISPATTSAYTYTGYTLPTSTSEALIEELPDTTTGTMNVKLFTYDSSGTQIGSADSSTFTVTVPSSIIPTASATFSESSGSFSGLYAAGISKINVRVAGTGSRGSTPQKARVSIGSEWTSSWTTLSNGTCTITSPTLTVTGSRTISVYVMDSRGRTSSAYTTSFTVYEYSVPSPTISIATSGTTATVALACTWSSVNGQNSGKTIKLVRKKLSDSTTVTVIDTTTVSAYSYSNTVTQTISDLDTETYEFIFTVTDKLHTGTSAIVVKARTGIVTISMRAGGDGVDFFHEATSSGLRVDGVRLAYRAGDTLGSTLIASGCISSGATVCSIGVMLPQIITADTFTLRSITLSLRHVDGGYVGGVDGYRPSSETITAEIIGNGLKINITNSSGWGITNNTPVAGTITLTGTFS